MTRTRARQDINPMVTRTVHEVAFRLSYDMSTQISPRLGEIGAGFAPQQLRAMRLIWSGERTTLGDLASTLKRDKGQVVRLIDELCKAGMLVREPNPYDGRSKILVLTDKAHALFAKIEEIEAKFAEDLTQGIAQRDLDVFFKVSDQLSANLRDIEVP